MSSTFKNRIPKRKYRERGQVKGREHLGLLEKKKDYIQRAKNYHQKEDKLKLFKQKAQLKNQDEFYFKMLKSKKNEQGKIQIDEDDSDFDQKQFRAALKTQNFNIVKLQKSIVEKKIQRLQADLHLLESQKKPNNHKIFLNSEEEVKNFQPQTYFNTPKQLIDKGIINYNVQQTNLKGIDQEGYNKGTVKNKYQRLSELMQKEQKLTKLLLTIGYEKNLQSKDRSKIKKIGKNKIHKFFMERKK